MLRNTNEKKNSKTIGSLINFDEFYAAVLIVVFYSMYFTQHYWGEKKKKVTIPRNLQVLKKNLSRLDEPEERVEKFWCYSYS